MQALMDETGAKREGGTQGNFREAVTRNWPVASCEYNRVYSS